MDDQPILLALQRAERNARIDSNPSTAVRSHLKNLSELAQGAIVLLYEDADRGAEILRSALLHLSMANSYATTDAKPYRVASQDDYDRLEVCEDYSLLVGPDGWYEILTEPEDRTWSRDGAGVVARLNEQHAALAARDHRIEELEDEVKKARDELGVLTDHVVHYRNMAIRLGATPRDMMNEYDRSLCRRGLVTGDHGGWDANIRECWDAADAAESRAARAEELLRRLRAVPHALSEDYLREIDAFLAEKESGR